jgi:hypothetical protein
MILFGALVTAALWMPGTALRPPRRQTPFVGRRLHHPRVEECAETPLSWSSPTSSPQATCLQLRGGGIGGAALALLRTALRNPVLLACT